MGLLQNLFYILAGFVGLVIIFLVVLSLIEKKIYRKFLSSKYTRNHIYIEKLSKINIQKPDEGIRTLSNIARNFFREAFRSPEGMEFSEFEQYFIKKNNRKASELSNKIVQYMYSRMPLSPEELQNLINLLAEIISSNRIITREEKKELDKKAMKNQPWEKRSKIGRMVGKFKDKDQD